jgi:hypothetical protein
MLMNGPFGAIIAEIEVFSKNHAIFGKPFERFGLSLIAL